MYDRKRKKSSNNNITNRQIDSIGSLEPSESKKERKKEKEKENKREKRINLASVNPLLACYYYPSYVCMGHQNQKKKTKKTLPSLG